VARLLIVRGRLKGMWWDPLSGGKVLRVLGGTYEREQTELFATHVRPGATVLDVGAHVGYYTLLAARLAGTDGRVLAFEPEPGNAERLRRHVALNRLGQVEVVEAAVAARPGAASFARGTGSGTGRLMARGDSEVRTVAIDDEVAARGIRPAVIKIDVEGAERIVLEGADRTLRTARPVLFLSTHGPLPHTECTVILERLGYTLRPILGDDVASSAELLCLPGLRRHRG
jgi:FkbM family methyltransferase